MSLETDKDLLDEQAEHIQKLEAEIERLQRQLGEATARIETDRREIQWLRGVIKPLADEAATRPNHLPDTHGCSVKLGYLRWARTALEQSNED